MKLFIIGMAERRDSGWWHWHNSAKRCQNRVKSRQAATRFHAATFLHGRRYIRICTFISLSVTFLERFWTKTIVWISLKINFAEIAAERILGIIIRKQMAGPSRVMFKPFTPMVWGLLGLLLLFTVAYDVFCSKILANTHRMRKLQNSCPPAAVGDPFMTHFGVLTQRSVNVNAADWSRRILYGFLFAEFQNFKKKLA